jgi:hypothetical protein
MWKIVIGIILVVMIACAGTCLYSFFSHARAVEIYDVEHTKTIIFENKDTSKSVINISIFITGYIDGTAVVQRTYENGEVYDTSKISGMVTLRLGGDWYSNKCAIVYRPENVRAGKLKIRYEFGVLDKWAR